MRHFRKTFAALVMVVAGCSIEGVRQVGESCLQDRECVSPLRCIVSSDGRSYCVQPVRLDAGAATDATSGDVSLDLAPLPSDAQAPADAPAADRAVPGDTVAPADISVATDVPVRPDIAVVDVPVNADVPVASDASPPMDAAVDGPQDAAADSG